MNNNNNTTMFSPKNDDGVSGCKKEPIVTSRTPTIHANVIRSTNHITTNSNPTSYYDWFRIATTTNVGRTTTKRKEEEDKDNQYHNHHQHVRYDQFKRKLKYYQRRRIQIYQIMQQEYDKQIQLQLQQVEQEQQVDNEHVDDLYYHDVDNDENYKKKPAAAGLGIRGIRGGSYRISETMLRSLLGPVKPTASSLYSTNQYHQSQQHQHQQQQMEQEEEDDVDKHFDDNPNRKNNNKNKNNIGQGGLDDNNDQNNNSECPYVQFIEFTNSSNDHQVDDSDIEKQQQLKQQQKDKDDRDHDTDDNTDIYDDDDHNNGLPILPKYQKKQQQQQQQHPKEVGTTKTTTRTELSTMLWKHDEDHEDFNNTNNNIPRKKKKKKKTNQYTTTTTTTSKKIQYVSKMNVLRQISICERNDMILFLQEQLDLCLGYYWNTWNTISGKYNEYKEREQLQQTVSNVFTKYQHHHHSSTHNQNNINNNNHVVDEQQQQQQYQYQSNDDSMNELVNEIIELQVYCIVSILTIHQILNRYDTFALGHQAVPMYHYYLKQVTKRRRKKQTKKNRMTKTKTTETEYENMEQQQQQQQQQHSTTRMMMIPKKDEEEDHYHLSPYLKLLHHTELNQLANEIMNDFRIQQYHREQQQQQVEQQQQQQQYHQTTTTTNTRIENNNMNHNNNDIPMVLRHYEESRSTLQDILQSIVQYSKNHNHITTTTIPDATKEVKEKMKKEKETTTFFTRISHSNSSSCCSTTVPDPIQYDNDPSAYRPFDLLNQTTTVGRGVYPNTNTITTPTNTCTANGTTTTTPYPVVVTETNNGDTNGWNCCFDLSPSMYQCMKQWFCFQYGSMYNINKNQTSKNEIDYYYLDNFLGLEPAYLALVKKQEKKNGDDDYYTEQLQRIVQFQNKKEQQQQQLQLQQQQQLHTILIATNQNNNSSRTTTMFEQMIPSNNLDHFNATTAVSKATTTTTDDRFSSNTTFPPKSPPPPPSSSSLSSEQYYHIGLNLTAGLLYCMNYYIVEPSSTMYVIRLGAFDAMSGTLIGMTPFAAFLAAIPYSMWTNYSFRSPFLVSCTLLILGNSVYGLADKFGSVYIALLGRFICGLGAPKCLIRRYMADTVPLSLRTSVNAGFGMVVAAGSALGPAFAIVLNQFQYTISFGSSIGTIELNGMTLPGYFMACLWSLYGIVILLSFKEPNRDGLKEQKDIERTKSVMMIVNNNTHNDEATRTTTTTEQPIVTLSPTYSDHANDDTKSVCSTTSDMKSVYSVDSTAIPYHNTNTGQNTEHGNWSSSFEESPYIRYGNTFGRLLYNSMKFSSLITLPVRICLLLLFAKVFTIEALVSATSVLSKNRYGWHVQQVGMLGVVNGMLVIPFSIMIGKLSLTYQDHVLMKGLVLSGCIGMFLLIDVSDLLLLVSPSTATTSLTYNEGHILAVTPIRYVLGYFVSYLSIQAFEGVIGSALSKVIPTKLASGTFNSGLLATLVDTFGRTCGDLFISIMGYISIRQLMNLLFTPSFMIMISCYIMIERYRDLLVV